MNPYKILEIDREATQTEIKTAYRTLSKKHHPDTGGDEDKFKILNLAYRVLSDEKKRKLYDEQGIIMDDSPDHLKNLITARMVDIAEKWLDNMIKGGSTPLSSFALSGFDTAKKQIYSANIGLEASIDKLEGISERLTCSNEDSIIHTVIQNRIETYKKGISQNKQEVDILNKLREIISSYEYEEKVQKVILTNNSTTCTVNFEDMFGAKFY
jgi:curved DNA-binding protein CbpA